ncbi:MAG: hypothetical protein CW338_02190 [Clostridiales bacterium]|nr:hypothetical protein [Clostridiales bacterium]
MKKTAKVMISLLMIAALLCCLCACGKKEPTLVGKWDALNWICAEYGMSRDAVLAANPDATVIMEFAEDGIMSLSITVEGETETNNYPYKVDGNTVSIGGVRSTWYIVDDVLTLQDDLINIHLPRIK